MEDRITKQKLERYLSVTKKAIAAVEQAGFDQQRLKDALDFLDMAKRYFSDSGYFMDKGDYVNAFAAVNYSHGWLDSGARIGLFKVKDSKLFTVD